MKTPKPLRGRLLIRFLGGLILGFILFGGALFWLLTYGLTRNIDRALAVEAAWIENALAEGARSGEADATDEIAEHVGSRGAEESVLVLSPDGGPVFSSFPPAKVRSAGGEEKEQPGDDAELLTEEAALGALRPLLAAAGPLPIFQSVRLGADRDRYRIYMRRLALPPQAGRILALLSPMEDVGEVQAQFILWLLVLVPAVGIPFGFGARNAAAKVARPLEQMARDVEQVTLRRLSQPILVRETYREVETLAASFNRMTARLDASVAAIKRFTSDASHELRTPLAVLKSQLQEALQDEALAPETREIFQSNLDEVIHLEKIVGNLLTLSRYDSGKIVLESVPVDLTDIVFEQGAKIGKIAEARNVEIRMEESLPVCIQGDPTYLAQMVFNVLENAVKYNRPDGRVIVRLESRPAESVCRLVVADTGFGIPSSDLPRVYERFYRVDPSRSRDVAGSGLGLSLVRMIAELHGGTVLLDSREGEGTRVEITLPFRAEAQSVELS